MQSAANQTCKLNWVVVFVLKTNIKYLFVANACPTNLVRIIFIVQTLVSEITEKLSLNFHNFSITQK